MNCQSFENVINELVREQMMEATEREEAILHSQQCEACAARLQEEQALTASLRELSSAMSSLSPSPSLEEKLLVEFRNLQSGSATRKSGTHYWAYAAVAALFFVIVGAGAMRLKLTGPAAVPVPQTQENSNNRAVASDVHNAEVVSGSEAPLPTVATTQRIKRPVIQKASLKDRARRTVQSKPNIETLSASNREIEVATEFLPVGYSSALSVQDGGQVVRVELPRSAMATFGLPVNMDRYNERVKADVLLGADGLARAIRFVQ